MKKEKWLLLLMCYILLTLALTACDTEYNDVAIEPEELEVPPDSFEEVFPEDYYEDAPTPDMDYEMVEIEGIMRRIMPPGSLTIEHFLEDLDYFVYVLENNFPLLGVANWAHGIDYQEMAANARASVLSMEEPCEGAFLIIMIYHFFPLLGTGHFMIIDLSTFENMVNSNHYGGYRGEKWLMNRELLMSPLANRFYGEWDESRLEESGESVVEDLFETFGGPPSNRFSEGDFIFLPFATEIIEEDRVAYISTGSSMAHLQGVGGRVRSFMIDIEDYDHLIIDLRGNTGGNINHFLNNLLRPLLREAIETPNAFYFFFDGPYVRRFGDLLFRPTTYTGFLTITEPYRPINEISADFNLPDIRHTDIDRMHYGAPAGRGGSIEPIQGWGNFDGKVWMLINHQNGSAAQMAAWYASETEHITLVGDRTGGAFGGPRTMALMPNTGIAFYFDIFYVTDRHGNPLEAGTVPHYWSRPGMDALETVLALIDEWDS